MNHRITVSNREEISTQYEKKSLRRVQRQLYLHAKFEGVEEEREEACHQITNLK